MKETLKIRIRAAERGDLPAIVGLLAEDQLGQGREDVSEPLDPCYSEAFEALTADPNQELIVLDGGGEIVATMQLSFLPGLSRKGSWRCQIEAVRVAKDRRGGGVGRTMVEHALERARARGCRLVQLTSDRTRDDAHAFYSQFGFVDSHLGFKLELGAEADS